MPGAWQGCPAPSEVSPLTSHFHRCPLRPPLPTLSPQPATTAPLFSQGRGNHLTAPSQHQMVPINFVHTQLPSVNWKAQTPNILQMKQ